MFTLQLRNKNRNLWLIVAGITCLLHGILLLMLFFLAMRNQHAVIHIPAHQPYLKFMPIGRTTSTASAKAVNSRKSSKNNQKLSKKNSQKKIKKTVPSAPKKQEKLAPVKKTKKETPIKKEDKIEKKLHEPKKIVEKVEQQKVAEKIPPQKTESAQECTHNEPLIINADRIQFSAADLHIYEQIIAQWHPPQGFEKQYCKFKIIISADGVPTSVELQKSSGIPAYDIAARAALLTIHYPQEKWASELIIAFGELPS